MMYLKNPDEFHLVFPMAPRASENCGQYNDGSRKRDRYSPSYSCAGAQPGQDDLGEEAGRRVRGLLTRKVVNSRSLCKH